MNATKIYVFSNVVGGREGPCVAIAEDGAVLASHWCSHENFAQGDLGVLPGCRPDLHEIYAKHFSGGHYEMEFVPAAAVDAHAGLTKALNLNRALAKAEAIAAGANASKYSAEWVAGKAAEKDATWLGHHDCGACREEVGYVFDGPGVRFRSACGCSWSPDRPSSFADIADWLAMQSSDEIRDRIMDRLT